MYCHLARKLAYITHGEACLRSSQWMPIGVASVQGLFALSEIVYGYSSEQFVSYFPRVFMIGTRNQWRVKIRLTLIQCRLYESGACRTIQFLKMPENSRGVNPKRLSSFPDLVTVLMFFIFATLLVVVSSSSTISAIHSCNKGRFIMNSTWGFISNGPENYREDSYCIWLIEGN